MAFDAPSKLKLEELTKEQLIKHCEREAEWQNQHGHKTDVELRKRIEFLEAHDYIQGYMLDKIWSGVEEHGGYKHDPKVDGINWPEARKFVGCFWHVIGKLATAEGKVMRLESMREDF